jgi:itaconate CoA-transferase
MTPLPLRDITVVALGQAVAAPFATRHLADLGARVIKIERPGTGDFARDYSHAVNGPLFPRGFDQVIPQVLAMSLF